MPSTKHRNAGALSIVRLFVLSRLAANAGMSIGPAVGGLLAGLWFPSIFLVDGLSALVAGLILRRRIWAIRGPGKAQDDGG